MGATTKAELEAMVKRLQRSLDRAETKIAVLDKSLGRANAKIKTLGKSLADALERGRATAEILKLISRSPTDLQPVFDAIAATAFRLVGDVGAVVTRIVGDELHLAAFTSTSRAGDDALKRRFPVPISDNTAHARAIRSCKPYCISDTDDAREVDVARARGYRSRMVAPMLRGKTPIGTIAVSRRHPGPFSKDEVELLKTFADQAVIAIENARLFNETKEALEQQSAISEVLRVMSDSPTDVKPVLDTVLGRAARICEANDVDVWLLEGGTLKFVAGMGQIADIRLGDTRPLDRGMAIGRAVIDGEPVHIEDVTAPEARREFPLGYEYNKRYGARTGFAVPLMREGRALGGILLRRSQVQPFTQKQINLLKTFADQAAIAIENVRLFKALEARNAEVTEALGRQTATANILRVISSSPTDIQPVLDAIAQSAAHLCGAGDGIIQLVDGETLRRLAHFGSIPLHNPAVTPLTRRGINHCAIRERRTIHEHDMTGAEARERYPETAGSGGLVKTMLVVPMLRENIAIGTIALRRTEVLPFTEKQIELVETFASQAVIAIENVRLFNEIQDKSRQLEIANRHKSEFLANMSHELRTPLNAVIGFSEVLQQGMVGALNEKQGEYVNYIHASGSHLLSLINDILDLSKVEAGRMELDLANFSVSLAIDNALTLIKERATRHGLSLDSAIDADVTEIQADERKFKQVMLNLLSNAVKFTPEGGSITVAARPVDGMIQVSVTDTGIGIAPEDCEAVFEEFRQVGLHAEGKAQGTGLGLALTKKFIELHGGRIWLTSTPGKGSTFSFTLPITQPEIQAAA